MTPFWGTVGGGWGGFLSGFRPKGAEQPRTRRPRLLGGSLSTIGQHPRHYTLYKSNKSLTSKYSNGGLGLFTSWEDDPSPALSKRGLSLFWSRTRCGNLVGWPGDDTTHTFINFEPNFGQEICYIVQICCHPLVSPFLCLCRRLEMDHFVPNCQLFEMWWQDWSDHISQPNVFTLSKLQHLIFITSQLKVWRISSFQLPYFWTEIRSWNTFAAVGVPSFF